MITYQGQSQVLAETNNLINRTGAATVLGQLLAQDILQSDADDTDYVTGLQGAVAVATANLTKAPLVVVGKAGVADDALVPVVLEGVCDILGYGTINIGDTVIPVNAQQYVTAQTGSVRGCGKALEAHSGTTASLIKVWFKGYPTGLT